MTKISKNVSGFFDETEKNGMPAKNTIYFGNFLKGRAGLVFFIKPSTPYKKFNTVFILALNTITAKKRKTFCVLSGFFGALKSLLHAFFLKQKGREAAKILFPPFHHWFDFYTDLTFILF